MLLVVTLATDKQALSTGGPLVASRSTWYSPNQHSVKARGPRQAARPRGRSVCVRGDVQKWGSQIHEDGWQPHRRLPVWALPWTRPLPGTVHTRPSAPAASEVGAVSIGWHRDRTLAEAGRGPAPAQGPPRAPGSHARSEHLCTCLGCVRPRHVPPLEAEGLSLAVPRGVNRSRT